MLKLKGMAQMLSTTLNWQLGSAIHIQLDWANLVQIVGYIQVQLSQPIHIQMGRAQQSPTISFGPGTYPHCRAGSIHRAAQLVCAGSIGLLWGSVHLIWARSAALLLG